MKKIVLWVVIIVIISLIIVTFVLNRRGISEEVVNLDGVDYHASFDSSYVFGWDATGKKFERNDIRRLIIDYDTVLVVNSVLNGRVRNYYVGNNETPNKIAVEKVVSTEDYTLLLNNDTLVSAQPVHAYLLLYPKDDENVSVAIHDVQNYKVDTLVDKASSNLIYRVTDVRPKHGIDSISGSLSLNGSEHHFRLKFYKE